jgi:hypothetical protein
MPTISASYTRDANHVPMTAYGFRSQKSQTLSGNNATVSTPLFRVTGTVLVKGLYGQVTTALGSNITAAFWRLNDQTAQVAISLATGTTLSAAPVGSMIVRLSLVSVALSLKSSAAGAVLDPVAATAPDIFMPFVVTQKTGAINTDIEFTYTTTNTPTSGVIVHNLMWLPLSDDGNIVVQ